MSKAQPRQGSSSENPAVDKAGRGAEGCSQFRPRLGSNRMRKVMSESSKAIERKISCIFSHFSYSLAERCLVEQYENNENGSCLTRACTPIRAGRDGMGDGLHV